MNGVYPFSSPIILTDSIYNLYGGNIEDTKIGQRTVAYFIAERDVSHFLNTLLLPTIVTGTFHFNLYSMQKGLELDWGYVSRVTLIRLFDVEETNYYTISGTANVYASLRDADLGIVDLHYLFGSCGCGTTYAYPYKVQVVYEAGLQSGTTYQANNLMALATMAEIYLNEIVGYGNESTGDIGVESFSNLDYDEKRFGLMRTSLGSSAKANLAAKLLAPLRKIKFMRLR